MRKQGLAVNNLNNSLGKNFQTNNNYNMFYDYITGLPNRHMLESSLSACINKSYSPNKKLAVICLDLDRFSVLNYNLGHHAGDRLLKEVAQRLNACLNSSDLLFKHGGDEFFILVPDVHQEIALKVAKDILIALNAPFVINDIEFNTSASIGISLFPDHGQTSAHLICNAESAKQQAKTLGGNTYCIYSKSRSSNPYNPLKMEMDLRKAIDRNELILHYQPKVNIKTGKIVGAEALIRWNHPEWGLVSPGNFIPLAEETGLIVPIGEWAIKTACKQNKIWHSIGLEMVMSVNLSIKQFTHSNLVDIVKSILEEIELPPYLLELEITESMMADINNTITTLYALKKLGVKMSIDDFGTGFSSLNYLSYFPVDLLKIDQSFIRALNNNENGKTIVETIISMAHKLNVEVVAEGVETKDQLQFLENHQCDIGQGYFFNRPVPAQEFENIFQVTRVKEEEIITKQAIDEVENIQGEPIQQSKLNTSHNEKLDVVGKLAAGIVHEIRNPLTAIMGFIQLLEQGNNKQEYFRLIRASFNDIEKFIDKLLIIANPQPIGQRTIHIKPLMESVIEEIRDTRNLDKIRINQKYENFIQPITCDVKQIKKVFLHVITNSIEALADGGEVKIHVLSAGRYVLIRISDNGNGMSKERLEKLGEPYFINNEKGTGLGMALCYRIISQHNGMIYVNSLEGKGTVVELRLPINKIFSDEDLRHQDNKPYS
ncbi:EAL domain-containing protein [Bacillus sp. Marseille-P3661]|uniref:EAL domain-containing protein n=1 Tax=Bacillus sp. Marseille-P3661 TaxID=1936234 RepID=UPI000C82A2FC|nr:EAL domain-containing protein [Bacillus sp. Marseille-P3661]